MASRRPDPRSGATPRTGPRSFGWGSPVRIPRFRVRTLMIGVAVLGAAILGPAHHLRRRHLDQLSERYSARAAVSRSHAAQFRAAYEGREQAVFAPHHGREFARTPALKLAWARYFEARARKYERAALDPGRPVAPDPPPPEVIVIDMD